MELLLFWFALEIGYLPKCDFVIQEYLEQNSGNAFYIDMQTKVFLWDFYIGGGIKNICDEKLSIFYVSPNKIIYLFQMGWKTDNIEIGFRHYCIHPIIPYLFKKDNVQINYEGSYEELYIRLQGEIIIN